MAEDNLEYSPARQDIVKVSEDSGVSLYVEIHMTEDAEESMVSKFVQDLLSRGHAVSYGRDGHQRIDLYVAWSDDQNSQAQDLKRWVAELPFVRLLTIEYAYDHRKARESRG